MRYSKAILRVAKQINVLWNKNQIFITSHILK